MSIPQRGLELMRYYFYHPYGKGGAHTTQILNAELQRLNVQRIGRIEITDLVKDGDAVSGAVGFHAQSGTPCVASLERKMACGLGACLGCTCRTKVGAKTVCKDGPVFKAEEVFD